MIRQHLTKITMACLGLAMAGTGSAGAETNMMFILDASNSMWGEAGGSPKIDTARTVLSELLMDIAEDTKVGLMAYGHRSKDACDDIEVLSAIGATDGKKLVATLGMIQPKGKTPIGSSLSAAGQSFPTNDANNNVVLISDGIETCDGDPCAVSRQLANSGIKARVHVVGFDVDDAARKQLECIAEAGNGRYFNAQNASELELAVNEVKQVAQAVPAPTPEPAPVPAPEPTPVLTVVLKDEFEGEDLAEHWQVKNPDPDGFIVEKGHLLAIAGPRKAGFDVEAGANLMILGKKMPEGDWDLSAKIKVEIQTGAEAFWVGLYKDDRNHIAARVRTSHDHTGTGFHLEILKVSNGVLAHFAKLLRKVECSFCGLQSQLAEMFKMPMTLSLMKRGRAFSARLVIEGDLDAERKQIIHETDAVSSLRPPGGPAVSAGQISDVTGETLFHIDRVEVTSVR